MYRKSLLTTLAAVALMIVFATDQSAAANSKNLAPTYKTWLDHDVVYLISKEERDVFLSLATDQERDQFIQHFWDIRNPSPGAPENTYRTEIYRRIAYANERFGTPGLENGWRTERGRVYIQLGEPKQRAPYLSASETRPFEIWFYDNGNPALPPFFYIVFYQKDIGGDFKLYSPSMDGPDKIASSSFAINDRVEAFKRIDRELGREVARTLLSLIPTEPVDIDGATSTMGSDMMLATLRNLPNHPLTKAMIKRNEDLLASVSHRIILSGDYLDVLTNTLRDQAGDPYVNYLLRVKRPVDFAVVKQDDRYYYSTEVAITIRDEKDKVVMSQTYPIAKYMNQSEYDQVKSNVFGVEGILPLPPGKYKSEILLTNKAQKSAFKVERELVVDGAQRPGLSMSQIMGFSTLNPAPAQFLPFTVGGLKFTPQLNDELTLSANQPLTVMYQLWNTPGDPKENAGKKLHIEYTYGQLGLPANTKKVEEDVAMDQFDQFGSMTTGKKLSTEGLPPGNYRLLVAAIDPDSQRKTFGSLSFHISQNANPISWDVYDDSIPAQYANGTFDMIRGHALIALGRNEEALPYIERAYRKNAQNENARDALADLYFAKAGYDSVIQLYGKGGINPHTSDATVLNFATSFARTGKLNSAVDVLESAISVKPPSDPIYLALASYYDQLGNSQKADETKRKMQASKK